MNAVYFSVCVKYLQFFGVVLSDNQVWCFASDQIYILKIVFLRWFDSNSSHLNLKIKN